MAENFFVVLHCFLYKGINKGFIRLSLMAASLTSSGFFIVSLCTVSLIAQYGGIGEH